MGISIIRLRRLGSMKCILRPRDYGKDNYCPDKFLQENEAIYKTMMGETK